MECLLGKRKDKNTMISDHSQHLSWKHKYQTHNSAKINTKVINTQLLFISFS